MRADCGFCEEPWLNLLESQGLRYIVVAKLNVKIQKIIKKDLQWSATPIPGTEVAQMNYQGRNWSRARRVILIRHRVEDNNRSGGKVLLDCPGLARTPDAEAFAEVRKGLLSPLSAKLSASSALSMLLATSPRSGRQMRKCEFHLSSPLSCKRR